MTKNSAHTPTSSQRLIEEIDTKIAGLLAQDKTLLGQQLAYEQAHVVAESPKSSPDARDVAATLLNGYSSPAETEPTDGRKLHELLIRRQGIVLAVDALRTKSNQARILALAEVMNATGEDWRALQRKRVESLLELYRLNREAAAFRDRVWKVAGRDPSLVADVRGTCFDAVLQGDAYQFVQVCVSTGIITRREVDLALNNERVTK